MTKTLAIVGPDGFVGSHVVREAESRGLETLKIKRGDDTSELASCACIIYCANSPSRYKASLNPELDYSDSVLKTRSYLDAVDTRNTKFVLISSISARSEVETVYGANRLDCENIVLGRGGRVARLGYMFSPGFAYGAVRDLLEGNRVYLAEDSEYTFTNVAWVAKKILDLFYFSDESKIVELGCKGSMTLKEVALELNSTSNFADSRLDVQVARSSFKDQPESSEFREYLTELRSKHR